MSAGRYISDTPVSARVDVAWQRGYDAGKAEKRATVALVLGVFATVSPWLKGKGHLLPWVIMATVIVSAITLAIAIPVALALLIFKGVRFFIRRQWGRQSSRQVTVTLSDGSTF
jgi:hypothetical protein